MDSHTLHIPSMCTQRTTSTKTRIKTHITSVLILLVLHPQRTTSTKTRIKTQQLMRLLRYQLLLREQLPLKQGLRPHQSLIEDLEYHLHLREQLPLKQGLRQQFLRYCGISTTTQRTTSTKTRIKT